MSQIYFPWCKCLPFETSRLSESLFFCQIRQTYPSRFCYLFLQIEIWIASLHEIPPDIVTWVQRGWKILSFALQNPDQIQNCSFSIINQLRTYGTQWAPNTTSPFRCCIKSSEGAAVSSHESVDNLHQIRCELFQNPFNNGFWYFPVVSLGYSACDACNGVCVATKRNCVLDSIYVRRGLQKKR